MESLITLVVPVYNVEQYICRCVDSILNQSFVDFDLILVDDGSPDKCGALCDSYNKIDSRVHVIHQKNYGLSAARNTGIEWALQNSNSKWIGFIDSDDWVHPQYLEFLYQAVTLENSSISVCSFSEASEYELPSHYQSADIEFISPERFWQVDNTTATVAWGKLYSKELFATTRYPVGKIHEDEFVTYCLLFSTTKIPLVTIPLYFYFQNANGIKLSRWNPARLAALEAFMEQVQFFKNEGYSNAYAYQARRFVRLCGRSLERIEENVADKKERIELQKHWQNTLQSFVKEHRKVLSFAGNPRAMIYSIPLCYWLCSWGRRFLWKAKKLIP